jgi:uncharacterized membrane protein (DUF2068 family)
VTVLAILNIIVGILGILVALLAFAGASATAAASGVTTGAIVTGAVIALVLSALTLAAGIGLWQLQPWARAFTIVVAALDIIFGLINLFAFHASAGAEIVRIVIAAIIIYYLFRPEVQAAFGRGPGGIGAPL